MITVWQKKQWIKKLLKILLYWVDLPTSVTLKTSDGGIIPAATHEPMRVVHFNAFGGKPSLKPHSTVTPMPIRSVIASPVQHPEADDLIREIHERFDDELHHPKLARDVDPNLRGPYGVAQIVLKEDAKPCNKRPFRTLGEREEALKEIIDK